MEDLGQILRRLRRKAGLTQNDVAGKMGLNSSSGVAKIERPGADPHVSTVTRFLDAIGATWRDLIEAWQPETDGAGGEHFGRNLDDLADALIERTLRKIEALEEMETRK